MASPARKALLRFSAGFGYGLALLFLAVAAGSAGHGLMFPAIIVSAPVGYIGGAAAFLSIPFLWGTVSLLAVGSSRSCRCCASLLLVANYIGATVLLTTGDRADFEYWERSVPELQSYAVVLLVLYALGQIVFWWPSAEARRGAARDGYSGLIGTPDKPMVRHPKLHQI